MFQKVTKGSLSGKAGEAVKEDFKINGLYVDTPEKGVVGIPFFDGYVEKAALDFLDQAAKSEKPFFINVNFMKVHQPNMPHPDYQLKSLSKSKYADSVVELDARIGRIMDKLRTLGLDKSTLVFYTTDNGAWQDVYPDAGYTPFRGTKGHLARRWQSRSCHRRLAWEDQGGNQEPRHLGGSRSYGDLRCHRRREVAGERSRKQTYYLR
jgi:arylsulfatase